MKNIRVVLALLLMVFATSVHAQKKKHKIVFQFTNASDTMQQKAFTKQLQNLTAHWPNAQIEVVLYNQGLEYVMTSKSKHLDAIKELKAKGVVFLVCENTMAQRKIAKEEIISEADFVPAGIAEIVEKQEKGWSYIKGGF